MTKILFISRRNTCRSPLAEYIMKKSVQKAGLEAQIQIDSAATSQEEIGCPVDLPIRQLLSELGIDCSCKTARRLQNDDYDKCDLLIGQTDIVILVRLRFHCTLISVPRTTSLSIFVFPHFLQNSLAPCQHIPPGSLEIVGVPGITFAVCRCLKRQTL